MYQSTHTGAQVDEAVDKALSADAVPTPGSTNLVQSGGVASAVSDATELKVGDSIRYTDLMASGISNNAGTSLAIPMTTRKSIPAGVALTATNIQVAWIRGNGSAYTASSVTGTITITSENSYRLELAPVSLPGIDLFMAFFSFTLTVTAA